MSHCYICHEEIKMPLTWSSLLLNKQESRICLNCEGKFARLTGETCSMCSRELDERFSQDTLCLDCVRWENNRDWAGYLTKNSSLFHYNEWMKDTMAKYKYRGDYALAEVFAVYLKDFLMPLHYDLLTVIPLSEERQQERGFNQAEALLAVAKLPCTQTLTRIHSEKQSKKTRQERMALAHIFQVSDASIINRKSVVLIDDIYTTGSTIRHAAKALHVAGASQIQSVTIAR